MTKGKLRLIVWILNGVVAVLGLVAIFSYFFAPYWTVGVTYNVSSADFEKMIGENMPIKAEEVIGPEGKDVRLDLKFETTALFRSVASDAESTVDKFVDDNVDNVIGQLTDTINEVAEDAIRSIAKNVIKDEVHKQVKNVLSQSMEEVTDGEVQSRLDKAEITDDYIAQKSDEIFNVIDGEDATVDKVSDEIIETVEDVYSKLKNSGDEDFADKELSEEDKDSIRQTVNDNLEKLANQDGTINRDDLIANLLLSVMKELNKDSSSAEIAIERLAASDAQTGNTESKSDQLKGEVKKYIYNVLPDGTTTIIVWVMRGLIGLFALSSLAWIYILIKMIVKLVKHSPDPTVKLKMSIILGWLPVLIAVMIPSLAIWIIGMTPAVKPGGALEILTKISLSLNSVGWIAFAAACVCIAISIFYIVIRKKFRGADDAPVIVPAAEDADPVYTYAAPAAESDAKTEDPASTDENK